MLFFNLGQISEVAQASHKSCVSANGLKENVIKAIFEIPPNLGWNVCFKKEGISIPSKPVPSGRLPCTTLNINLANNVMCQ